MEFKYDVFISYSRRDYINEDVVIPGNPISAIQELFEQNNISYWIDKEGIYSGQEFIEVITDAINVSKMVIFISSKASNASIWTAGEVFEALDAQKTIIPVLIDDTPYNKKFKFILRPLDYVDMRTSLDSGLKDLLRAVNKEIEDIAVLQKQEEEARKKKEIEARKQEIIKEIELAASDYKRISIQQETLLKEIIEKNRYIGNENKDCPVCGKTTALETNWCDRCGYVFQPLFALDGKPSADVPKDRHYSFFRSIWRSFDSMTKEKEKATSVLSECMEKTESLIKEKAKILRDYETQKETLKRSLSEVSASESRQKQMAAENKALSDRVKQLESSNKAYSEKALTKERENADLKRQKQVAANQFEQEKTKFIRQIERLQQENAELLKKKSPSSNAAVFFQTPPAVYTKSAAAYSVLLKDCGPAKLQVIKVLKERLDLGLKEAKELSDKAPVVVGDYDSILRANQLRFALEEAGAVVETKAGLNNNKVIQSSGWRYQIVLTNAGSTPISIMRNFVDLFQISVSSAKKLVDSAPVIVHPCASEPELKLIIDAISGPGGQFEICPVTNSPKNK